MNLLTLTRRLDKLIDQHANANSPTPTVIYLVAQHYRVFNSEHHAQPESAGLSAALGAWGIDPDADVFVYQVLRTEAGALNDVSDH